MIVQSIYHSPIGDIEISGHEKGIVSMFWIDDFKGRNEIHPLLLDCYQQLDEYFNGIRKAFDIELDLQGSDFQKGVWSRLRQIPYGETITYLELAQSLGDKKKIRAVGRANGKNPFNIIVPCHRVIGSDGSLVGYGGGLWRKQWLLEFERAAFQTRMFH